MLFSLVIPTCNRPDFLESCLNEIASLKKPLSDSEYEVIVTDDSLNDATRLMMASKFPQFNWLAGPKRGPAANRNNGAKKALGRWLIFLDDDVIPDNSILLAYTNAIIKFPDSRAFEGAIFPDDWNLLKNDMSECPVNDTGGCFWSANIAIAKELFTEIGGFNETFLIAAQEDQEIFDRICLRSIVPFLREAFVIHPVRIVSLRNKIWKAIPGIKNWSIYSFSKYGIWGTFRMGFLTHLYSLLRNIKTGKPKSATYNLYVLIVYIPVMLMLVLNTIPRRKDNKSILHFI
jgi:glycosyltransferase involved in cell wall biosynthesis